MVDVAAFKATVGSFVTGVGVMTTVVDGVPHGMTANAVSSVSLAPPLVLVCVDRGAAMADRVVEGQVFALSFLAADQEELSVVFADASRPTGVPQFDGVAHRAATTGSPILDGNVGWLDCRVWSIADGGDHLIVIGEVVALGADADRPLAYYRGAYGAFAAGTPDGAQDRTMEDRP